MSGLLCAFSGLHCDVANSLTLCRPNFVLAQTAPACIPCAVCERVSKPNVFYFAVLYASFAIKCWNSFCTLPVFNMSCDNVCVCCGFRPLINR